eukprot:TRINITY_DN9535_c0_g1_i1.p1 TRINITY_DN9535_c0_g1~~TRINITY_DN9535_c0_g1_i1.p1  ORF type:complete len:431 (+),score=130.29 TRINITY_DN9535_c0_g1_i1:453-1745(+)
MSYFEGLKNNVIAILGSQWGDEGKGKLVDLLAKEADFVGRYNGGANAGHTIVVGDTKYAFHLVPSGILYDNVQCVLGNGVVIHVPSLFKELDGLTAKGINYQKRFFVSDRAHILFDLHKETDGLREEQLGDSKIGTTKQGIGPCYTSKMQRCGVRVGDLKKFDENFVPKFKELVNVVKSTFPSLKVDVDGEIKLYREYAKRLEPMIVDTVTQVFNSLKEKKKWLVESANATMLDIDFGTYPYVTSSCPSIGGACTGLAIPPKSIDKIIGIVKAYCTRVGEGPFPSELLDERGLTLRDVGKEFGTTTGRARRCGWLDLVQVRYAHMINQFDEWAVTKLDCLRGFNELKVAVEYRLDGVKIDGFPAQLDDLAKVEVVYETVPGFTEDISSARKFEDLPENARKYIELIEKHTGVPVKWIGVGPSRDAIIIRN